MVEEQLKDSSKLLEVIDGQVLYLSKREKINSNAIIFCMLINILNMCLIIYAFYQ